MYTITMPTIQKRKVKGNYYYYIVESRRINGKPRPIVIQYLGSIENILKHYGTSEKGDVEYKSYSHGAVCALWEIAQKHGILNLMRRHFKEKKRDKLDVSSSILLAGIQRACEPGSKRDFAGFAQETTLPQLARFDAKKLTSQHFWDQMNLITDAEIDSFQKELTEYLDSQGFISRERLSFDTTNFFTYISSRNLATTLACRGHNKQKRDDLRQFSLALMVSGNCFIPLSHFIYEGNVNDMGITAPYIERLKSVFGEYFVPDKTTLVFDKGCCSNSNLDKMEKEGFHYISSFSLHHAKPIVEVPLADYSVTLVKNKEVRAYRKEENVLGKKRTVVLYYSERLHAGQVRGLNASIEKKAIELNELQDKLSRPKTGIKKREHLERNILEIISGEYGKELFPFMISESPLRFTFSFDEERYSHIVDEIFGKKALITDQTGWSTSEILESYFCQSDIEKVFKHLKDVDHHSIRPQYHWTDQKIRVHVFICLLGFLLTCILQKEFEDKGVTASKEHLLDTLKRIRQIDVLRLKKKKGDKIYEKRLEKMNPEEEKYYKTLNEIVNGKRG